MITEYFLLIFQTRDLTFSSKQLLLDSQAEPYGLNKCHGKAPLIINGFNTLKRKVPLPSQEVWLRSAGSRLNAEKTSEKREARRDQEAALARTVTSPDK